MQRIGRSRHDEEGMAMVVAVLVAFVVLLLSVAITAQVIHSVGAAGYDGQRLNSVSSAEAGLDWAYNKLEDTPIGSLWTGAHTGSTQGSTGAVSYSVTPTYFANTTGTAPFIGIPSASNYPASVKIVSVATSRTGVTRTMESFMALTPVFGGVNGAIITNNPLTLGQRFTLSGNSGSDGDIIVNTGDFSAPSGLESIQGNVYVPAGSALIGTNVHVYGSVWANLGVTVNQPQAVVDGDVKSTTAGTTVTQGTVRQGASYCTGSAPGSNVLGRQVQTCALGTPPAQAFPFIQYVRSAWASAGYYEKDYRSAGSTACTQALNWLKGTGSNTYNGGVLGTSGGVPTGYSGVVILTPSTCQFASTAQTSTVNLGTNVAILAYGGINVSNNTVWTGTGATRNLFFMSPYDGTASQCPSQDVTVDTRNTFSNVNVSIYTPCTAHVANNNGFNGQIVANRVDITNAITLNYRPVLIPGTAIVGFKQDVAYIREVAS